MSTWRMSAWRGKSCTPSFAMRGKLAMKGWGPESKLCQHPPLQQLVQGEVGVARQPRHLLGLQQHVRRDACRAYSGRAQQPTARGWQALPRCAQWVGDSRSSG